MHSMEGTGKNNMFIKLRVVAAKYKIENLIVFLVFLYFILKRYGQTFNKSILYIFDAQKSETQRPAKTQILLPDVPEAVQGLTRLGLPHQLTLASRPDALIRSQPAINDLKILEAVRDGVRGDAAGPVPEHTEEGQLAVHLIHRRPQPRAYERDQVGYPHNILRAPQKLQEYCRGGQGADLPDLFGGGFQGV